MLWSRRHLRSLAWVALVAMLALALAPTLSRAAVLVGSGPWSSICSTAEPLADPQGRAAPHVDHCPLCSHAGSLPALPANAWAVLRPAGAEPLPAFVQAVAHLRPVAGLALARAPPAHA